FFGCDRHVDVPHGERAERVHHGIHERGRTSDGTRFADAFDAQRIYGRWSDGVAGLDPRNVAGFGQRVVHKLARDELAAVIIDGLFPEGLAEALHDASMDLAFDDQRVEKIAAVIDSDIALDFDGAGFAVDFGDDDVGAERE